MKFQNKNGHRNFSKENEGLEGVFRPRKFEEILLIMFFLSLNSKSPGLSMT